MKTHILPNRRSSTPVLTIVFALTLLTQVRAVQEAFLYPDPQFVASFFAAAQEDDPTNTNQLSWKYFLNRPHPTIGTLRQYFDDAAREFSVPTDILEAIGQVENNWTQIGPSVDQGWGIMHLVRNSGCTTLDEAAQLLGLDPQVLQEDARQNIRGAAALLSKYAGTKRGSFTRLEDWFDVVAQFSGLASQALRTVQANRYYGVLFNGSQTPVLWGETLRLPAHTNLNMQTIVERSKHSRAEQGGASTQGINGIASSDFPSAIANLTTCNYTAGRNHTIDTYVNHWVGVGTYAGAISWFQTCRGDSGSSAHFVIRASDGEITQVVRVADTAWHAGAIGYPYNNSRSIGVEHEVTVSDPTQWNSAPLLQSSTSLARYLCDAYSIPKVRALPGIRGHNEMPGTSTDCPGPLPWDNWMAMLLANPGQSTINGVTFSPASGAGKLIGTTLAVEVAVDLTPASPASSVI